VRHRANVRAGQRVAVIGCGGVGLNAIQAARLVGATQIIAVDLNPAKLARAKEFGATDVVDATADDPVEAVLTLTGGGADQVLEVVGLGRTIEQAFAMTGVHGQVTVVGVARPEETVTLPPVARTMADPAPHSRPRDRYGVPSGACAIFGGAIFPCSTFRRPLLSI